MSAGRVPMEAISQIDRERVEHADKARREIEAFIRRVAPEGSPKGYGNTELEILNGQRESEQSFAPYQAHKWKNPTAAPTPTPASAKPSSTQSQDPDTTP